MAASIYQNLKNPSFQALFPVIFQKFKQDNCLSFIEDVFQIMIEQQKQVLSLISKLYKTMKRFTIYNYYLFSYQSKNLGSNSFNFPNIPGSQVSRKSTWSEA